MKNLKSVRVLILSLLVAVFQLFPLTDLLGIQTAFTGIAFGQNPISPQAPVISFIDPNCNSEGDCNGDYLLTSVNNPGKVSLIDDNEQLIKAKAERKGVAADGVTVLFIRVYAWGYSKIKLSVDPGLGYLMQRDGSVSGTSSGTTIDLDTVQLPTGRYAFAIYQGPNYFPSQGSRITLKFKAEAATSTSPISSVKNIELIRTPVVFVHGLWSTPQVWDKFQAHLRNSGIEDLDFVDYSDISAESFDHCNKNGIVQRIDEDLKRIRRSLRSQGIVMTQVDIIAHSMGGLAIRSLFASKFWPYLRRDNYFNGDFHKLITIGTPHYGSPLANFLVSHQDADPIKKYFTNDGKPIGPAIPDLQPGSAALLHLGPTDIMSHSIVGITPLVISNTEENLDYVLQQVVPFTSISYIFSPEDRHDTIVSASSQKGSLKGEAAEEVGGIVHSVVEHWFFNFLDDPDEGETTSDVVLERLESLIREDQESEKFTFISGPPALGCGDNNDSSSQFLQQEMRKLKTSVVVPLAVAELTPSPGTNFQGDSTITISFNVPNSSRVNGAMFSIGGQLIRKEGSGPFSFSAKVTPNRVGKVNISATTYGSDTNNFEGSTYIFVKPNSPVVSLNVSSASLILEQVGSKSKLSIKGKLANGVELNLTSGDTGTAYSVQSGKETVISVTEKGLIEAKGVGQDTLIVTHSGIRKEIPVSVRATSPAPILTELTPNSVIAGSNQFILTINGSNFLNDSIIYWQGKPCVTSFISPTQLTAIINANNITEAGTVVVGVYNPYPRGGMSSLSNFVVAGAPSLSPQVSSATFDGKKTVTIIGTKFGTGAKVLINNVDRSTFVLNSSDTEIQLKAKQKKLGLKAGENTIQIIDSSDRKSNIVSINL